MNVISASEARAIANVHAQSQENIQLSGIFDDIRTRAEQGLTTAGPYEEIYYENRVVLNQYGFRIIGETTQNGTELYVDWD